MRELIDAGFADEGSKSENPRHRLQPNRRQGARRHDRLARNTLCKGAHRPSALGALAVGALDSAPQGNPVWGRLGPDSGHTWTQLSGNYAIQDAIAALKWFLVLPVLADPRVHRARAVTLARSAAGRSCFGVFSVAQSQGVAKYCSGRSSPGLHRGLIFVRLYPAYRLTWTLVPKPSAPARSAPSPLETTFTQSASLSL